jgi:hypothetical protein
MLHLDNPATIDDALLDGLGNVDPGYQHHDRQATPGELLVLPGALVKWYEVRRFDTVIPEGFAQEARDVLRAEAEAGRLDVGYGLCFAVLHYSTRHAFVILGCWHGNQELWGTFYARDLRDDRGFELIQSGRSHPVMCVWELGPACHEREAWIRYLYSARDAAAKRAYLADLFHGSV